MTTTSSTNFDEFQRYRIPNHYVQWYELEPTFNVFSNPNPMNSSGNNCTTSQESGDQKKKKIRSTSAYALFFREKQSMEKRAAPYANFGQISQSIARQWEMLSEQEKNIYKQRCEKSRKTSIANAVEERARKLMMAATQKLQ
ncbi:Protein CBR-HMG-6 [Caenorhabditis briggsae]|uniref:HMG box domain-containing protein n=2 Tax=Caenorhabditis briggsae TaxID=6238 RepID=A0AAE9DX54_CAEBR|nr:Protein CBR-HMG-6 [Caenorhabditis briggsae]ULU13753.1 hypothetical protein L3Y34_016324 [Caenorhabditis briggsae]UMM14682.1 hypothetical protein L5515_002388 [Caenorhabditis briggsae]CAP36216.1 Protein CBR-HMG-6 [Caenorhabditis briggsae]